MEQLPSSSTGAGTGRPWAPTRKRSASGAGGLLSKIPFIRSSAEHLRPRSSRRSADGNEPAATFPPTPSFRSIPSETSISSQQQNGSLAGPSPISLAILQQQTQQQQKTRRRRGSLRKVALLGRGAQRERREAKALAVDTKYQVDGAYNSNAQREPAGPGLIVSSSSPPNKLTIKTLTPPGTAGFEGGPGEDGYGLGISDITPRPSMDGYASRSATSLSLSNPDATPRAPPAPMTLPKTAPDLTTDSFVTSPSISYSTTDDEDGLLHMTGPPSSRPSTNPSLSLSSSSVSLLRPERASLSSGSEGYLPTLQHGRGLTGGGSSTGSGSGGLAPPGATSIQRRRSTIQRAKSPLALTALAGLSTTPLPPPDADWDYSETEKWGWVVLVVTWTVFVTGMGSCLGVWSWAWDVGTTPYAPPEFEDDPTLPIVGYYPALIILTAIMAWVWVVVAWVGMKYFRHARVSGD
ncbi:hypothetical protein B0H63DRAFT_495920 [Podospora didyma]|uniref:Uncharacterized protein n=2 Tax=Podospora didyma TaxID=330526 RepID=A0AAE0NCH6_9PEZI|nr:hypothetical protein B0H63DRAFT_495920 [Podospora didyma]